MPPSQPLRQTFRTGRIEGVRFEPLQRRGDQRGWLLEVFRRDQLDAGLWPEMAYLSLTLPGAARGPHEHAEQTDMFAFIGPGDFKLYCWDARERSPTAGNRGSWIVGQSNRCLVVVPPGVVHAYKNVSSTDAMVINCPNRLYAGPQRRDPIDEIRHEDCSDCPYLLD